MKSGCLGSASRAPISLILDKGVLAVPLPVPLFLTFIFPAAVEVPTPQPECIVHGECSDNLACIEQRCQDPCAVYDNCAPNAECHVTHHRAVCSCPDGYVGNPYIQCLVGKISHTNSSCSKQLSNIIQLSYTSFITIGKTNAH